MRILFVSPTDAHGASLCCKLKGERNHVKWFIKDKNKDIRKILEGVVEKIDDLDKGVSWVGKEGLIVFDDVGMGKVQDELRNEGYSVVGGCKLGDKLEKDRQYGQKIFSFVGMNVSPSTTFYDIKEGIDFLKSNPGPWVIKQSGDSNKTLNYVSKFKDNRDLISLLENYKCSYYTNKNCSQFDLQKRIKGVEISIARYFNGKNWVGPIEISFEYKDFFNGGVGPKTDEMGTLMWYSNDEKNKVYSETLSKLKEYLARINFRGDIAINCIVNRRGVFPLEATARFGYPATQLQMEIHNSSWAEFLKAVADGKNFNLGWKKGFGIVVLVAAPPFPYYRNMFTSFSPKGLMIYFKDNFKIGDQKHIHLEEVARKRTGEYYICANSGYIMHVSGVGKTIKEARKKVYSIIEKVVIPKKYYRTDIGLKFIKEDRKKLKEWGYL
ncbi:MAG: hypothetical protein FJZ04_00260 [Candidatus Moranbacteria bacterium]|nr:hypothetical protein [Candidatus Moranbacteria bacterium]